MLKELRAAPNLLTFLRLCLIPFLVIAVLESHYRTALCLFAVAGLSDGLDGLAAQSGLRTMELPSLECTQL